MDSMEELKRQIEQLKQENVRLKSENEELKLNIPGSPFPAGAGIEHGPTSSLSLEEYKRYGRQMIVPGFGSLASQIKLKQAKVLVIGAGGLGCPALLYLCGAGLGTIGIVDNDHVDTSNLHRQVLHTSASVGMLKCHSAKRYLVALNPNVEIVTHPIRLGNDNAFDVVSRYDLVVDCTDTPATRYLINDVCVLLGKTVVSGSGVKSDGQFTILNFANKGPCYRCFYPRAPKPESVSTCGDAGVLGPAIGLTGIALATETIKVLTGHYDKEFTPFISMYCALPDQTLRKFKMRNRKPDCVVCGDKRTISRQMIESHAINYTEFCGAVDYDVCPAELRLSVQQVRKRQTEGYMPLILDVRPEDQYKIVLLPGSVNLEWVRLSKSDSIDQYLPQGFDKKKEEVLVVCRYGNDSRYAAHRLVENLGFTTVHDMIGGIHKWATDIDPTMPIY